MLYCAVCCVQLCYLCSGLCCTYVKDNVLPKRAGNEFQGAGGMYSGLEMAPHENKWSPLDGAHK